ncbi:microfibril-associated glycoprotein 4-like [Uranotaenia lowii]|uniref:microfibril-associated glycoprotein 4-like n=1 Tax=Uranotaenia lowii TaxID=190385 RepID=UPI00247A58FE|nr:microfibril-associated glycoprotein 4-like [Uranotaenia lowii]
MLLSIVGMTIILGTVRCHGSSNDSQAVATSIVNNNGMGYELVQAGLDAINFKIQQEFMRSMEYQQRLEAEIEDLRRTVLRSESSVTRDVAMLLNDTRNIRRKQNIQPTTQILKDFVLQLLTERPPGINHTSSMELLESEEFPKTCSDVGVKSGGVYRIKPQSKPFDVYCETEGWTVIQRRFNGSVDFYRGWKDYENGFGDFNGEMWLGLSKIYQLVSLKPHELHIRLMDFDGKTVVAHYDNFQVAGPGDKYRLINLGKYKGDAGDSLVFSNNMTFTTLDQDNDEWDRNCAVEYHGGWWFKNCHHGNLNGEYLLKGDGWKGVYWNTFRGLNYSLKESRIMIRARNL